jgi:hypothetical protein
LGVDADNVGFLPEAEKKSLILTDFDLLIFAPKK